MFQPNEIEDDNNELKMENSMGKRFVDVKGEKRQIQGKFQVPFEYPKKRQTWRKPFNFEGSILNRFKQHWKEEEQGLLFNMSLFYQPQIEFIVVHTDNYFAMFYQGS